MILLSALCSTWIVDWARIRRAAANEFTLWCSLNRIQLASTSHGTTLAKQFRFTVNISAFHEKMLSQFHSVSDFSVQKLHIDETDGFWEDVDINHCCFYFVSVLLRIQPNLLHSSWNVLTSLLGWKKSIRGSSSSVTPAVWICQISFLLQTANSVNARQHKVSLLSISFTHLRGIICN